MGFEVSDEIEKAGYSTYSNKSSDGRKLQKLGWKVTYDIESRLKHMINILKQINNVDIK